MKVFPVRASKNHYDLIFGDKKDAVAAMFGLEAQGYLPFIERALKDGAGWTEIAKTIGWINYGVFQDYYKRKYKDTFEKHNVLLIKPAHGLQKGWFLYNQEKKEWIIMDKTVQAPGLSMMPTPCVERIILMPRKDCEDIQVALKELNEHVHLDFNMTESNPFNQICFHCYMKKDEDTLEIAADTAEELTILINEQQNKGFKLIEDIYFDLPSIDNADKLRMDKNSNEVFKDNGVIFN